MTVLQGSQSKMEPADCVYINSVYCTGHLLLWNCLPQNRQHCCIVIDITTGATPLGCAQSCAAYGCVYVRCPDKLSYRAFVMYVMCLCLIITAVRYIYRGCSSGLCAPPGNFPFTFL
jgi:hypothetical protein